MAENYVRGMDCKLYYDADALAAADASTGDWTLAGNVQDVTINLETGEADITTRANNGYRQTAPTLKDGSIETTMLYLPDDAAFAAFQTAWSTGAEIAVVAMDGLIATSDNQGLAGNFTVTNFSIAQPLEEGSTVSVTLKPSSFTHWYTVS